MATRRKGKRMISVDFTGVEAGGGRLLPEDTYQFEVEEVEEKEGEDSGQPYLAFTLKVTEGDYEGTKAWDNFSLQPQALWKLRGFMEAAGLETTDGPMEIDPEEFVGLIVTGAVIHEDYKGRQKHRIDGYQADDAPAKAVDEKAAKTTTVKRKTNGDATEWKVRQEVSFQEGKKTLTGKITEINDDQVTVRVGKEEYEMTLDDLSAA